MSLQTREANYLVPLYLYASEQEVRSGLYAADERRPNLAPNFIQQIETRVGLTFSPDGPGNLTSSFGPEDIFNYIYAILHASEYRHRYAEFLRSSFPRVPLTSDLDLFRSLIGLGEELTSLHLMESPALDTAITSFPIPGEYLVEPGHPLFLAPGETVTGTEQRIDAGRVYISKDRTSPSTKGQYFDGVPVAVWEFYIGGFQICHKWLKDRRGQRLTLDDISHFEKIVVAVNETIRLTSEIDDTIPAFPLE